MPKKTTVLKESDPESLKQAGNKAFQAKNFEEAIKCYNKAIELDPKNYILFSNSKQDCPLIIFRGQCLS